MTYLYGKYGEARLPRYYTMQFYHQMTRLLGWMNRKFTPLLAITALALAVYTTYLIYQSELRSAERRGEHKMHERMKDAKRK